MQAWWEKDQGNGSAARRLAVQELPGRRAASCSYHQLLTPPAGMRPLPAVPSSYMASPAPVSLSLCPWSVVV